MVRYGDGIGGVGLLAALSMLKMMATPVSRCNSLRPPTALPPNRISREQKNGLNFGIEMLVFGPLVSRSVVNSCSSSA